MCAAAAACLVGAALTVSGAAGVALPVARGAWGHAARVTHVKAQPTGLAQEGVLGAAGVTHVQAETTGLAQQHAALEVPSAAAATIEVKTPLPAPVPASAAVVFLVVGDWGRQGQSGQSDVAAGMGQVAHALGAQFVISTGDNVYNTGISSAADPLFRATFTDIYRAPSLAVPWYAVLGNHDWLGLPTAQLDGGALGDARWHAEMSFSASRVSTLHGGGLLEIFYVDTSPWKPEPEMDFVKGGLFDHTPTAADWAAWQAAQVARLDGAMARSSAAFKLIVGHHAIYSYSTSHGSIKELQPLNDVLRRHGASAYLNGHDHTLQTILRKGDGDAGPLYITSGAGSETRDDIADPRDGSLLFSYAKSGFSSVIVMGDALTVTHYDAAGTPLHAATVRRAVSLN